MQTLFYFFQTLRSCVPDLVELAECLLDFEGIGEDFKKQHIVVICSYPFIKPVVLILRKRSENITGDQLGDITCFIRPQVVTLPGLFFHCSKCVFR